MSKPTKGVRPRVGGDGSVEAAMRRTQEFIDEQLTGEVHRRDRERLRRHMARTLVRNLRWTARADNLRGLWAAGKWMGAAVSAAGAAAAVARAAGLI